MGHSAGHEAERLWLENTIVQVVKDGPPSYDWWHLYERAISQKLPKWAKAGRSLSTIVDEFCGTPRDPRCRIEDAPPVFAARKSKFRRAMVMAAIARLERDCRIERVDGAEIKRRKCRPARFEKVIAYRPLGVMDALAIASLGPQVEQPAST